MKFAKRILQSNKGFTIQDLAVAIIAIVLFAGIIGSTYVSIYKVQAETQVEAVATLFTVQIMEYIDKIGYDEVRADKTDLLIQEIRNKFSIPSSYTIELQIIPMIEEQDLVKTVKLTFGYQFKNIDRSIVIERLKVKEL